MHLIELVPNGKLEDLSLLSHLPRLVSRWDWFVRLERGDLTRSVTLLIDEKFVSLPKSIIATLISLRSGTILSVGIPILGR